MSADKRGCARTLFGVWANGSRIVDSQTVELQRTCSFLEHIQSDDVGAIGYLGFAHFIKKGILPFLFYRVHANPRMSKKEIENILEGTFASIGQEGITTDLNIQEATETTGGYLAIIQLDILSYKVEIMLNMQIKDDAAWLVPETHVISNPFLPAYSLTALRGELIVKEKMNALIERHKPRDVFDAYFFARHAQLRQYLPHEPETLARINKSLDQISDHDLEVDLKPFLPRNYQSIIKQLKSSVREGLGIQESNR